MKTKVLTARVPVELANEIQNAAKNKGLSVSEYISNTTKQALYINHLPSTQSNVKPKKGSIQAFKSDVDPETLDFLIGLAGGSAIGVGVYHVVSDYVKQNHPDKDHESVGMIAGVAVALLSMGVLASILRDVK